MCSASSKIEIKSSGDLIWREVSSFSAQRNTKHCTLSTLISPFSSRGWQRGDRDPVSRTNFNKIHASRF